MALVPTDKRHAAQILAGTAGRSRGHAFEKRLAEDLNLLDLRRFALPPVAHSHTVSGEPATELLSYVLRTLCLPSPTKLEAFWLGGLATARDGDKATGPNGQAVTKTKSDVLIRMHFDGPRSVTSGVSVKSCTTKQPTNAQLYFTTATAFCDLLRRNGLPVSQNAARGLQMFCGDQGFRPADDSTVSSTRLSDTSRWYWEELPPNLRGDLEHLFTAHQDGITELLLRSAYADDPYRPDFLLHQQSRVDEEFEVPMAIFHMDELVRLSRQHGGFTTKEYKIRKGTHKNDPSMHLAPRFGFVQFQRGGQRQHPTQLQFNLQAGYFRHLPTTNT